MIHFIRGLFFLQQCQTVKERNIGFDVTIFRMTLRDYAIFIHSILFHLDRCPSMLLWTSGCLT